MKEERIEQQHQGKTFEHCLVYDEKKEGKRPGVLIFPPWRGRDQFSIEKAKQIATFGYVGMAVDLYGKGVLGKTDEECGRLMAPFLKDRAFLREHIAVILERFKSHPMINQSHLGAIGFCFGGLVALDLARSSADLKGVVSFHGLLHPPEGLPKERIKAKVLVLHGDDDPMVSSEEVLAFEEEMREGSVDWQVHVYGAAMHAFTNPEAKEPEKGTVYNETANRRAMRSMHSFFMEVFVNSKHA
ncbi:MAG: dienelactone hydrolase family protein [Simkania negevensis]|nr:dienelactone hydrolase family protein [Simkania negevensis]